MTNLESLKSLYAKLGGNPSDVADMTTSAEVIDVLNEVAGGGGSSEPFVVTVTVDELPTTQGSATDGTADKTVAEILTAIESGKIVYCTLKSEQYSEDEQIVCPFMNLTSVSNGYEDGYRIATNVITFVAGMYTVYFEPLEEEDVVRVILNTYY